MTTKVLGIISSSDKQSANQVVLNSLNEYKAKNSLTNYIAEVVNIATKEQYYIVDDGFKESLGLDSNVIEATKADIDALIATKANISDLEALATKDELNALATKAELSSYALKSEVGSGGGATYAQIVASLKYLGLELPTTLKAYSNYDLFSDDRLTGDLSIAFTPISYAGSYGQAWENVAIYNENDEKLAAKYASISSDGLTIEAVFAKDIAHPKGDSWEAVPEDYVLLDGEVRATITLGASSYYGASYGLRILNNNPSSWGESFLAGSHSYSPWVFRFHNYKPSKFSITNGTATYGGYGYMTKYNLTLSVGNWSKTLTYENSSYPNNIEIDFRNLAFGSDAKTIELAKAWGVPVSEYNPNDDIRES